MIIFAFGDTAGETARTVRFVRWEEGGGIVKKELFGRDRIRTLSASSIKKTYRGLLLLLDEEGEDELVFHS